MPEQKEKTAQSGSAQIELKCQKFGNEQIKAKELEGLTEKDLYCIARHIQEYVKTVMHGEDDFPNACVNCPHRYDTPVIHCHWDAFGKLSDLTGVNVYPAKGFKV
jgi:hypothetical protein